MTKPPAQESATDPQANERGSLRKLWLALALLCLLVAVNVWIGTQGGALKVAIKAAIGLDFEKNTPEAVAALWGIIFLAVFLALASGVLIAHARQATGTWADRYAFRLFELPPSRGIGYGAQIIGLIMLTLLPAYMLGHSWLKLIKHAHICYEEKDGSGYILESKNGLGVLFFGLDKLPATSYRLTGTEKPSDGVAKNTPVYPCGHATSYYLPIETWILAAFTLLCTILFSRSMVAVFVPHLNRKR